MGEGNTVITGGAGEGLPDRTPLTLAEVVSWLAWRRAFTCEDFRLANDRNIYRQKVKWLEAAHRTGENLNFEREALSRSEAKRAEMEQAAGGAGYDSEAFADGLGKTAARLFDAVRARRLAARAKRCDQDAGWTQIPEEWLWIDPTDPRPPIAILDGDRMTRDGDTPLWQIVGPRSHDPERAADWFAVRFEREEVLRAFPPDAASTRGAEARDASEAPPSVALKLNKSGKPERDDWVAFDREMFRRMALDGGNITRREFRRNMKDWAGQNMEPDPDDRTIERRIDRLIPNDLFAED
jgi:hypothetical protein